MVLFYKISKLFFFSDYDVDEEIKDIIKTIKYVLFES